MGWLIVLIILVICGLVAYLLWASCSPDVGADLDEPFSLEEELQARLDLYRIKRGVDVTLAKHEQRREAERVKQAIAKALEDDSDLP